MKSQTFSTHNTEFRYWNVLIFLEFILRRYLYKYMYAQIQFENPNKQRQDQNK